MGQCCSDEDEEGNERLLAYGTLDKGISRSPKNEQQQDCRISSASRKSSLSRSKLGPEKELVQSEKRYFKHLKILHNEFIVPLFNKRIFPKSKHQLFSNLSIIYNFHITFLKELQSSKDIPGLFIKQADFFKIYVQYVENYTLILECLAEFRENYRFVEFNKSMQEKNLHFESLLIAPIQRIPRYELLLKEMIRSSNKTGPEHEKLIKALDKVHAVAEKLNERKREFERLARMSYIASRIYGLPKSTTTSTTTLYHPHRKFIDEQEMKRRSKYDDNKQKPCLCLLFSDILITTDLSYKFKRLVQLNKVSSSQLVQRFNGLIFRVDSENDMYLFCYDLETAEEWMEKVLMARNRLLTRTNSRLSVLTQRSNEMKSVESNTEGTSLGDTPNAKSPTLSTSVHGSTLPIYPISSGGFSHPIVPRIKKTTTYALPNSDHSVQSIGTKEEPTGTTVAQNYDDYDI